MGVGRGWGVGRMRSVVGSFNQKYLELPVRDLFFQLSAVSHGEKWGVRRSGERERERDR